MRERLLYMVTLSCIFLMLMGCASATLDTYQPKSPDEEAIIRVLRINEETLQNRDLSGHLATYHDNASIMIFFSNEGRPLVLKERYAEWVPTSVGWGEKGGKFAGIKIIVSGDTATIKGTHTSSGGYSSPHTIVMEKENGIWLITNWSFGRYS
ncbi:MAG: nuclear transport factor 2 family protein [Desulfobacterales bacterium]|nr:MAG: nuclear transport factor 2 family protein [Desulfobacterales bacterium]